MRFADHRTSKVVGLNESPGRFIFLAPQMPRGNFSRLGLGKSFSLCCVFCGFPFFYGDLVINQSPESWEPSGPRTLVITYLGPLRTFGGFPTDPCGDVRRVPKASAAAQLLAQLPCCWDWVDLGTGSCRDGGAGFSEQTVPLFWWLSQWFRGDPNSLHLVLGWSLASFIIFKKIISVAGFASSVARSPNRAFEVQS